jgi:hypothetical protein
LLFQYQMPIGFRRELAGVRHAQLRLARDKALLEDMELDVSHGLSQAIRNLDTNLSLGPDERQPLGGLTTRSRSHGSPYAAAA